MEDTPLDDVDEILAQWRRERPDLDPTGMGVVLRILQLAGILSKRLDELLAPTALAPFEFDVLSALRRAGAAEGLTATELCAAAQVTSGAMTHRLDCLEERRLIRRQQRVEDRRALSISLTARGRKLVDQVLVGRMEDARRCVAGLRAEERRALNDLLRSLRADVEPAP